MLNILKIICTKTTLTVPAATRRILKERYATTTITCTYCKSIFCQLFFSWNLVIIHNRPEINLYFNIGDRRLSKWVILILKLTSIQNCTDEYITYMFICIQIIICATLQFSNTLCTSNKLNTNWIHYWILYLNSISKVM